MAKAASVAKASAPIKGVANPMTGMTPIEQLNQKYSGERREDASLAAMKRTEGGKTFAEGLAQGQVGYSEGLKTATDPDNMYRASKVAGATLGVERARADMQAEAAFKAKTGMDPFRAEMWRAREFNKSVNESNNERAAQNAVLEEQLTKSRQERSLIGSGGGGGGGGSSGGGGGGSSRGYSGGGGGGSAGMAYAQQFGEMETIQAELARTQALGQSVAAAKALYRR